MAVSSAGTRSPISLIPYVADMGFTHIEFLPITEHPLDASWGYQTTGLYAPSARFGDTQGFARFVDGAHRAGIGVILRDWSARRSYTTDARSLAQFDSTALYEHADPRMGHHPDWKTAIFNYGRREVAAFYLTDNAVYLAPGAIRIDSLRVDAGRLHALPRLLPRGQRVGFPNEHATGARTGRRWASCGA